MKLAAIRAGLGWQGKHSLLISRKYGTFLALGGIVTNASLEHNTEEEYRNVLGHLNTGIPYSIFRRNVLLAMEKTKEF